MAALDRASGKYLSLNAIIENKNIGKELVSLVYALQYYSQFVNVDKMKEKVMLVVREETEKMHGGPIGVIGNVRFKSNLNRFINDIVDDQKFRLSYIQMYDRWVLPFLKVDAWYFRYPDENGGRVEPMTLPQLESWMAFIEQKKQDPEFGLMRTYQNGSSDYDKIDTAMGSANVDAPAYGEYRVPGFGFVIGTIDAEFVSRLMGKMHRMPSKRYRFLDDPAGMTANALVALKFRPDIEYRGFDEGITDEQYQTTIDEMVSPNQRIYKIQA